MTVNSHPAPLDPGHLHFGGNGMHGLTPYHAVLYFHQIISQYRQFDDEVTLHRVTDKFDEGEIFSYKAIPIKPGDTPESLQDRLKTIEAAQWYEFITGPAKTNKLKPITRPSRIVLPGEEQIWEESIRHALSLGH
jgi:folate-dependent phosphoribosylglycinamide formyltransferase PurN